MKEREREDSRSCERNTSRERGLFIAYFSPLAIPRESERISHSRSESRALESENASVSGRSHTKTLNRPPARPAWRHATNYLICSNNRSMSIAIVGFNCDELHLVAPPFGRRIERIDRGGPFGRFPRGSEKSTGNSTNIASALPRLNRRPFESIGYVTTHYKTVENIFRIVLSSGRCFACSHVVCGRDRK